MKPKPFWALKNLTVPVAIDGLLIKRAKRGFPCKPFAQVHIRDFCVAWEGPEAGITRSGAIANIVYITTSRPFFNAWLRAPVRRARKARVLPQSRRRAAGTRLTARTLHFGVRSSASHKDGRRPGKAVASVAVFSYAKPRVSRHPESPALPQLSRICFRLRYCASVISPREKLSLSMSIVRFDRSPWLRCIMNIMPMQMTIMMIITSGQGNIVQPHGIQDEPQAPSFHHHIVTSCRREC